MPSKSKPSPLAQAELILELYELRRETVMREARSYIMNLPEWMSNLERLVEGSKQGRKRFAVMRKNMAAIARLHTEQATRPPNTKKK